MKKLLTIMIGAMMIVAAAAAVSFAEEDGVVAIKPIDGKINTTELNFTLSEEFTSKTVTYGDIFRDDGGHADIWDNDLRDYILCNGVPFLYASWDSDPNDPYYGSDYIGGYFDVTISSALPGTRTIRIKPNDDNEIFEGETATLTFVVKPRVFPKKYIYTFFDLPWGGKVYTGSYIKPAPSIDIDYYSAHLPYTAAKPSRTKDYTVTTKYSNNKNIGQATAEITVKFNGYRYTGTYTFKEHFTVLPAKAKITSLTKNKGSITLKWSQPNKSKVSGYLIEIYGVNNPMKCLKKVYVKNRRASSKKITGLKSGKRYVLFITTYKTVNGKKYWSRAAYKNFQAK